ncbi:MAG: spore coat protein CotJB [Acetobacter sp.]|nr:spore coat protein CotJB [Bacteroides sp.]MCM1341472.1 spore coat protein CotJB [Acetobacter sp.]MCM1434165.1 spore coat protein CotJB [Clostridiales bacterium]
MNKDKLLLRVSALGFAMQELRLFLDTHPGDSEAQQMFDNYEKKLSAATDEYEKNFGPLTLNGINSDDWLKDPWPWENAAN